jgi:hypothetical protein
VYAMYYSYRVPCRGSSMLVKGRMRPEAVELWTTGRPSMGSGVRVYLTKKEHIVPRARKTPRSTTTVYGKA